MTINSTRRGKGDEVIFLQLSWYLHHFFPLPSPAPSPCSGNSHSQTLGSCCELSMSPWAPLGLRIVPLGTLPSTGGLLESTA